MGLEAKIDFPPGAAAPRRSDQENTMARITTQQRARRMLRMQYQLGLDFVAIRGGGRKERAAYNHSMHVLLGAKAYRIARNTAR
jgi:hypothetical protein